MLVRAYRFDPDCGYQFKIMKNKINTIIAAIAILAIVAVFAFEPKIPKEESAEDLPHPTLLSEQHADSIISIIQTEGFDAAFSHYSTYRDISDPYFHSLRQNYIDAAAELMTYLAASSGKSFEPPYYLKKKNEIYP